MQKATIVVRNLKAGVLRHLTTLFAVALMAAVCTVFLSGKAYFRYVESLSQSPNLITHSIFPWGVYLRNADTKKVAALPGVVAATRVLALNGYSRDRRVRFILSGVDETYFTVNNKDGGWFRTTPDQVERFRQERTAFIVGEETARRLGLQEGHRYTILTTKGEIPGVCAGISRGGGNKQIMLFHYEYVDAVLGGSRGNLIEWLVAVKSADDLHPTIAAIDGLFKDSATPTVTSLASDHIRAITSSRTGIVGLLGVVSVLILFVTTFVTLNSVLLLVRERRQALATLRAIGFGRRTVVSLVLAEVVTLCLLGGLLGNAIVGILFAKGVPLDDAYLSAVTVPASAMIISMAVTLVLGLFAGMLPGWIASRTNITDALRAA